MDIQNAQVIYNEAFANLPASAAKMLDSTAFTTFAEMLANAANSDTTGVYSMLQSSFKRELRMLSIEQLIEGAPLAMQRQLDSAAIAKLVADPENGFAKKYPLLLTLPDVAMFSDGSLSLLGGNHRLAFLYATLSQAGVDDDSILCQEIQCLVTSIDIVAFKALLGAQVAELTEHQLNKYADKTLNRLWSASNGSRKATASEVKEYSMLSGGIARTVDGISAAFAQGNIDAKQAFKMLAPMIAKQVNEPQELSTSATVFPQDVFLGGMEISLSVNTVTEVLGTVWAKTGGAKVYSKAVKQDGMFAVKAILSEVFSVDDSYKTAVLYEVQGDNGEALVDEQGNVRLEKEYVPCSIFQHAIDSVHEQLLAENDKYAGNLARNKVAIGTKIAELLAETPLFLNYAERSSSNVKATVKSSTAWNF